jgi:3,2-trans-enoyl-CoA isomerase
MLELFNHARIREIRMARAPVNALNPELVKLLIQSLAEAETECSAVVLSGNNGVFSAGLDVVELMQLDHEGMTDFWGLFIELLKNIACLKIPVAAAITGHSPAGGAVMCLFTDYRVMNGGQYSIGLNETRVGLIIPTVIQNAMARLVGPRVAEQMLVTGKMIDPEEAFKTGFVDALETGYETTIEHAIGWCQELQLLPRHAMLGNRAVARAHFKREFANTTADSIASFVHTWFSEETQAVLNALLAQLKNKN